MATGQLSTLSIIPFDLVESIVSLLPIPDLLAAAAVSSSWRRAALASPRRRPPSLLLHTHTLHRHNSSATTATSTLEPNSQSWLHLPPLPSPPFPLRSPTSDPLLYALSSSHLIFSSDPLHLRWKHLPSPPTWRVDPVVALVGSLLVVAGGVSEYEDNPLAVEVFDGEWISAGSMPEDLKHSASASYLSSTVSFGKLHIVERRTGQTASFDPVEGVWSETKDLLADVEPKPFAVAVASTSGVLVVAGVMGSPEEVTGVRLWENRDETGMLQIGEMPADMVGRFARGADEDSAAGVWTVEVRAAETGGLVYVYNPSEIGEVFYFKVGPGGGEWGGVKTGVRSAWNPMKSVLVACSSVEMEDLRESLRREKPPAKG